MAACTCPASGESAAGGEEWRRAGGDVAVTSASIWRIWRMKPGSRCTAPARDAVQQRAGFHGRIPALPAAPLRHCLFISRCLPRALRQHLPSPRLSRACRAPCYAFLSAFLLPPSSACRVLRAFTSPACLPTLSATPRHTYANSTSTTSLAVHAAATSCLHTAIPTCNTPYGTKRACRYCPLVPPSGGGRGGGGA